MQAGEACDDGNDDDGDACTNACEDNERTSRVAIEDVFIRCTSQGQTCSPRHEIFVTTTERLDIQFTVSELACSRHRVHMHLNGALSATTELLGPEESSAVHTLGPLEPGEYALAFEAEGVIGGCN